MRHAIKRRVHKERAQPYERQKLGLLEKKKDYKQRAQDYHRKADTIKKLREKAALKNPDEFYNKMSSTQTRNGVHVLGRTNEKDADTLKEWKTQDLAWVHLKHTQITQKISKMQASLQGLSGTASAGAKEDSDSEEEETRLGGSCHKRVVFAASARGLAKEVRAVKRTKVAASAIVEEHLASLDRRTRTKLEKAKEKQYRELGKLMATRAKLDTLKARLQTQKNLLGKGARSKQVTEDKFGDEIKDKTVYKWKMERKK